MYDLSAIIIFHGEQYIAPASIQSFHICCNRAMESGLSVQRVAIIDKPDALTRAIVEADASSFDKVEWVNFGDLGLSRNAGRDAADGEFLAFLDGDDLWGAEWLKAGVLNLQGNNVSCIAHPEVIYYFSADDYLNQSRSAKPNKGLKSFNLIQIASTDPNFDARSIIFNNIWTANSIARREIYQKHPYMAVDRTQGFGVEDWTWNIETLVNGIDHIIVPDTVHCIRLKTEGSLGLQNSAERIIPRIQSHAAQLERF